MSKWVRQIHRWLSIAFTVTVIVTFVALTQKEPAVWVSYVPLLPLGLLLLTGLYLFVLPYATKWRSRRPTSGTSRMGT
jgi:heme A synthase